MLSSNHFVIRGAGSNTLTPHEYGRWAARWAFDIAKGEIKDLADPKYAQYRAVQAIRGNILPFLVHVSALYTAAYTAYTICVLHDVPSRAVSAIRQGVTVGMAEWLMTLDHLGLASSVRVRMVNTFHEIFRGYLEVLVEDFVNLSNRQPGVFYPDAGKADAMFLNFIVNEYWKGIPPSLLEKNALTFLNVTDGVLAFYQAQKIDIGIDYIP